MTKTMALKVAAISAILIISPVVEALPRQPRTTATLQIPRGGAAGIFGKVMDAVDDRSRDVAKYSKVKAAELDDATDRIRAEALNRSRQEMNELQKESKKLLKEAENAAKKKAAEMEKEARAKAGDLASVAKNTALLVATRWEKEARKKADDMEQAFRKKAAEVERSLSGKAAEAVAPPPKSALLSSKSSAILAHVVLLFVAFTSLSNLTGYPPAVITHWESGFGDKFLPFDAITVAQKRLLAGALEMSSIFLMRPKKTRAAGVGLITAMYTWSVVVNAQLNAACKSAVLAVMSAVAWMLLANELF